MPLKAMANREEWPDIPDGRLGHFRYLGYRRAGAMVTIRASTEAGQPQTTCGLRRAYTYLALPANTDNGNAKPQRCTVRSKRDSELRSQIRRGH